MLTVVSGSESGSGLSPYLRYVGFSPVEVNTLIEQSKPSFEKTKNLAF